MIYRNTLHTKGNNTGFTLVMAVVTTAMLLLVSFVVVNVALKQLLLANAAEESQYAFYSAESGLECVLYWDVKNPNDPTISAFATSTASPGISCDENFNITTGAQTVPTIPPQPSRVGGGGNANPTSIFYLTFGKGCAIVTVTKEIDGMTTVQSLGYNTCDVTSSRRFERGVEIQY